MPGARRFSGAGHEPCPKPRSDATANGLGRRPRTTATKPNGVTRRPVGQRHQLEPPPAAGVVTGARAARPLRPPELALAAPCKASLEMPRRLLGMFDRLDFVYLPSRDVAADLEHFTGGLGAEIVFAIEAFGTRVAMVRLAPDPPPLLFAGHLHGDQPILVYCVENLKRAIAELRDRHVEIGLEFEIPHGHGVEVANPGPQRIAVYERTRPGADERLAGRRDF